MHIGLIGTGRIGETLAGHFVPAGHSVTLSNSRGPESLGELAAELDSQATAGTVAEAAKAPVVVESIPFGAYETLPADALADSIVVSAANYYPDRDGDIDFDDRTQTELVAAHLDRSQVVKSFNTMFWETLRDEARPDAPLADRLAMYLAGDDSAATVATLIEDIGFAPVDVGPLAAGQHIEPGAELYNNPLEYEAAQDAVEALDAVDGTK